MDTPYSKQTMIHITFRSMPNGKRLLHQSPILKREVQIHIHILFGFRYLLFGLHCHNAKMLNNKRPKKPFAFLVLNCNNDIQQNNRTIRNGMKM